MNSTALRLNIIALTCGGVFSAQAQRVSIDATLHTADRPYIQATGEASVSVKPDQAVVEIGVVSQGTNTVAVAAQNAKQTDAVMADLAARLGPAKKLRTTTYSVRPNYQTPKPGATPTITGYTATNIIEVTLDDLNQVNRVIDAATQSGANLIQKLQYQLKRERTVRAQALREATEDAKASAEAMAAGLALKVLRVLSAEEVTPSDEVGFRAYKKVPPPPPEQPSRRHWR